MGPSATKQDPIWVKLTPYVLALLSLIAGISTWAINTQAKQDERITKVEEHIELTDRYVRDTLKEIKDDLRVIKKAVQ